MAMPAQPPETVNAYLAQLRVALKGAPAGLISDALADCEDHLNNEIAQNPDLTETQILASVIETYGTPAEIAEEYRDMEHTISTPFPQPESREERRFGFFNVISDPRTYGALLFMLLAFPTGLFYFIWSIGGIMMSLGFAILIFGVPFFLLFVASIRVLGHVEGRVVEALLGVRMPRRLPSGPSSDESLWTKIKEALSDARTWSSLFYMLIRLPLGIIYFVLTLLTLIVPLTFIGVSTYSLVTNDASHISINGAPYLAHMLHTAPGLILLGLAGILLFFVGLHIARGVGWLHAKVAEALLVRL